MYKFIVQRFRASLLLQVSVFGLAYFVGAELGHFLSLSSLDSDVATTWPPAGLLVAALTLTAPARWHAFLLASCIANLASDVIFHQKPVLVGLGFWLANASEACLGAYLLRRFRAVPLCLSRLTDALALVGFSALLSTMLGASLGALVVTINYEKCSYWTEWQRWWLADALGILVVAPVVLSWIVMGPLRADVMRSGRIAEAVFCFLGVALATEGVYGEWLPIAITAPAVILPFLLWAAFRLGPQGTSLAILLVAFIGVWHVSRGRGPYASLDAMPEAQVMRAQSTAALISVCVLILAALLKERTQAERARIALIAELEKALDEIKTLRGLIPLCSWCKNIRDDQGFWQRLEDYLCVHTEAEFTHGICPVCFERESATLVK